MIVTFNSPGFFVSFIHQTGFLSTFLHIYILILFGICGHYSLIVRMLGLGHFETSVAFRRHFDDQFQHYKEQVRM